MCRQASAGGEVVDVGRKRVPEGAAGEDGIGAFGGELGGDGVVGVEEGEAAGAVVDAGDEACGLGEGHEVFGVGVFEVEGDELVVGGLDGVEVEVGLFDAVGGGAVVVGAPEVAAASGFGFSLEVFGVEGGEAAGGFVDDGDDAGRWRAGRSRWGCGRRRR